METRMNLLSRRDALRMGAATLAALPALDALAAGSGFFARNKFPIGLQLYTVGDLARKDLDGTLKRIADIGYETIELAGLHGHTVAELRAAADALASSWSASMSARMHAPVNCHWAVTCTHWPTAPTSWA